MQLDCDLMTDRIRDHFPDLDNEFDLPCQECNVEGLDAENPEGKLYLNHSSNVS